MVNITPVPVLCDNYSWLISNAHGYVAIVDPGEAGPILAHIHAKVLIPIALLITHHHWDHVNGIDEILKIFPIPVYAGALEPVQQKTIPLYDGQMIHLQKLRLDLTILNVPGHTKGAISFYGDGCLFSGDTLFTAGCGRLFEGTPIQMFNSLAKLMKLPPKTKLYCGHEYTKANLAFAKEVEPDNAMIKERIKKVDKLRQQNRPTVPASLSLEQKTNPFLRTDQPAVIAAADKYAGTQHTKAETVFATLRRWKDAY